MSFFTYIVASGRNGTIYIGSTEEGEPGWSDLHDDLRRGGLSDAKDWTPPEDRD